ncbi:MAG: FimB/Mfa2 family fimbrial subunit, partial [Parabacteroides sp.]|nr:FimB/Mfa2 family fimbrial subunit [Parabacteroides sp.]
AAEDAILSVTNRHSEVEVIRVNLPDLLCQLRTSTELQLFSPQEFLDRGYDYRLTFFLRGDHWEYVQVEISVLSWIVRNQSIIL